MLRNTAKLLALAAGLTVSGQAFAQASDSEETLASVTLADPIALTETTALRFGSVLKGSTGTNTVTIDAATGDRSLGGGGLRGQDQTGDAAHGGRRSPAAARSSGAPGDLSARPLPAPRAPGSTAFLPQRSLASRATHTEKDPGRSACGS